MVVRLSALLLAALLVGCDPSLDIIDGVDLGEPLASVSIVNDSDYVLSSLSYTPCDASAEERSVRFRIAPGDVGEDVLSVETGCYDFEVFEEGGLSALFESVSAQSETTITIN